MVSTMGISNQNEIINWKENEQFNISVHPYNVKVLMQEMRFLLIFITILKSRTSVQVWKLLKMSFFKFKIKTRDMILCSTIL